MYKEYTQPYVNDYPQMANAMTPSMTYVSGGQELRPVTTTTRKVTTPVVVNRDSLISTLAGVRNDYKQALENANTFWGKLGKSVSDQQVRDALAAPTNKGRLESNMGWGQALSGALLSGLNTYGKFKAAEENKAAKDYEAALKQLTMEDSLMARKEAADLQNALNNQTVIVDGVEKVNTGQGGANNKDTMYSAAATAIDDLYKLSQGGIGGWNNESDSRWNSEKTANLLGQREAALSALIPITNEVAKASGGSGINTLGEMMAYLGIPENATSAQIAGALPGIIRKMPLEVQAQLPFSLEKTNGGFSME